MDLEGRAIGNRYTFYGLQIYLALLLVGCGNPFSSADQSGSVIDTGHHPGADLSGSVNATASTVSVTGLVVADGFSTATVQITLLDSYGAGVEGLTPTFSATDTGSMNHYNACTSTNASGVSTCTFTSLKAETKTVQVLTPVMITSGSVQFIVPTLSNSTISATPTTLFADGSTTSTVMVTLKDGSSNVIQGKTVSLASSRGATETISISQVTDSSGVATFTVYSSSAGSPVFTATDTTDSIVITPTVTLTFVSYVVSDSQSTVNTIPVSIAANGTTTATITATIKNSAGTALPGKMVSFVSNRGATDTLSGSSATTDASGNAVITVKSSTTGESTITVSVSTDSLTLTQTSTVLFLSVSPWTDWQPRLATGNSPGTNASTTTMQDLVAQGSNYGTLNGFAYNNTASGWAGNGGTVISSGSTGPYRLLLDGITNFVNFGTGVNTSSSFSFETWIRPSTVTGRGKVILSNGDTASSGITLRQAWDGSAKVSLYLGSNSYVEEVLADTPVAYWRLGETSNTSALDSSGNTSTATYTGGYTLNQTHNWGDSDKAVSLNGTSGYVQTPYTQTAVTAFTVEAWVKTTDSGSKKVIFHNRGNSSTSGKSLTLGIGTTGGSHGAAGTVGWEVDSDAIDIGVSSTATVHDGNWHHIVGTWAAASGVGVAPSQFKIYIDGALASTTSGTTGAATSPLTGLDTAQIGKHTAWATFLSGTVDEVAIYTSELSLTRIQAHYAARNRIACQSSQALTNDVWAHLTGVFDNTGPTLKLLVNGTADCSTTYAGVAYTGSVNPLSAGAQVNSPNSPVAGTYWKGAMGDTRTYNSALSPANVSTHYSTTSVRFP